MDSVWIMYGWYMTSLPIRGKSIFPTVQLNFKTTPSYVELLELLKVELNESVNYCA